MGAAFGLLPIGWIVFWAVVLYRITLETGKFEIIKDSIGGLTGDRRLQAMLIAFAFGAFIEGAAGFGTPVAVAAAMLTGLGLFAVLRRRHLSAREHGARRVRLASASRSSRSRAPRACPSSTLSAVGRPNLRAGLAVHPRLPDHGDGRLPGAEGRAPGRRRLRRQLRERAIPRIELHRSAARRHPGRADGDRRPRSRC